MRKIFALLVMSALSSSAFSMDEPEDWDEKKPEKKERRDPSIPPSPHPTPYPSLQPTPYSYEGDRFLSSSPPLSSSSMPREKKERKGREEKSQDMSRFDESSPPRLSRYTRLPSQHSMSQGFGESQYYSPSSAYPNSNSSNSYGRYGYGYGESSMGGSYHSKSSHHRFYEEDDILGEELQNVLASLQIDRQIMSNPDAMALTERYIAALQRGFRDGIWGGAQQKAHVAVETPIELSTTTQSPSARPIVTSSELTELPLVQGARDYLVGIGVELKDLDPEFIILGDGRNPANVDRFIHDVIQNVELTEEEASVFKAAMSIQ